MFEKWCKIDAIGLSIILNQNDRTNTSSKLYFQAFLSPIALVVFQCDIDGV
jgi:hypothetical protein